MLKAILILWMAIAISSCGTNFYIAQIDTTDPYIEKDKNNKFQTKSDSLEISYSFYGENAPLKIEVFNKMKRNLLIDWQNSYFIFGDDDQNRINLADFVNYRDHMTYLTPFTRDQRSLFELSNLRFHKLKNKYFTKEEMLITDVGYKKLKIANFTEETTPLLMRGFLALRIESADADPVLYPQEFYIKKIIKGDDVQPSDLSAISKQQSDHFYIRHKKGKAIKNIFQVTGAVLGGAVLVVAAVAVPATEIIEE